MRRCREWQTRARTAAVVAARVDARGGPSGLNLGRGARVDVPCDIFLGWTI